MAANPIVVLILRLLRFTMETLLPWWSVRAQAETDFLHPSLEEFSLRGTKDFFAEAKRLLESKAPITEEMRSVIWITTARVLLFTASTTQEIRMLQGLKATAQTLRTMLWRRMWFRYSLRALGLFGMYAFCVFTLAMAILRQGAPIRTGSIPRWEEMFENGPRRA